MSHRSLLLLMLPMLALAGCGVRRHVEETGRLAAQSYERLDPKRRAEAFKAIAQGTLPERDFESYISFVVTELRLKDALQVMLTREGFIRGYRLQTFDGFAGPEGAFVTGRLEVLPDYGLLVNEGVKIAFGVAGKLLPDKLVTEVARNLTSGNRFVGQFLDIGVDEANLDFYLVRAGAKGPDGKPLAGSPAGEVLLGKAQTDATGRAQLQVPRDRLPGDLAPGAYTISARVPDPRPAWKFNQEAAVHVEDGGLLFVRPPGAPPQKAVVINVSNTVFAFDSANALRRALFDQQYDLRDECTAGGIQGLRSAGYALVFLSGTPEGMAPLVRDELGRTQLLGVGAAPAPMVFKPMYIGVSLEKRLAFKTEALTFQKKLWGEGMVVGYLGDNPDEDGEAARAAGIPFLLLPKSSAGGWCAGVPPLIPAKTGR